jgi:alpha-L-rhamnosidase
MNGRFSKPRRGGLRRAYFLQRKPMTRRQDNCVELQCEYASNPLGIDTKQPRLHWRIDSLRRNMKQSAYQVLVSMSENGIRSETNIVWNSGVVESERFAHIEYLGSELVSFQRYYWSVRVRNEHDEWTDWSETAWWETGLLRAEDWRADWIEPSHEQQRDTLYIRNHFELDGAVASARAYVTSHGTYELSINGQNVGNDVLQPGYTSYNDRLQYQTYDVTSLLESGTNAIGIVIGDGWYRGKLAVTSIHDVYGSKLGALIQICITFRNGLRTTICSGNDWLWSTGPIRRSDMKDGEIYDARMEMPGWNMVLFDASSWKPVHIADHGVANLVASSSPPVRRQERIAPVDIMRTPKGQIVVDFGQNIAGRVRIKVAGKIGTRITLRHAESLDLHGNFSLSHLQPTAPGIAPLLQEDIYILRGTGNEEYEPTFSIHGFRYVEIKGWPGEPTKNDLIAIALYSDMEQTGTFECSDSRINRLHTNIVWSMKSNSVDIPTDCPTRERAGWTGDVQIFASTGAYLMNTACFLEKWLCDLAVDQRANGLVPNMIPDVGRYQPSILSEMTEGSAGWGDAAVIVPWTLYQIYGDIRVLENQYESMKRWLDFNFSRSKHGSVADRINPLLNMDANRLHRQPYILNSGYHWEEWLAPGENKRTAWNMTRNILTNRKSESMVATAYLAYSSGLFAKISLALNNIENAEKYSALHRKVCNAFMGEFWVGERLDPDNQSAYVRALAFELLPETIRQRAADRLAELITLNGFHLDTGFLSTPFLCDVLCKYGYTDLAYALLLQDTYPSWLYTINKDATTMWESWDAIDKAGNIHGSLNHAALGSIVRWLYQSVAGINIDQDTPGFQHFLLKPTPGGRFTHAKATYRSVYGDIVSHWNICAEKFIYRITVPAGTSAEVTLPYAKASSIMESGTSIIQNEYFQNMREEGCDTSFHIGSGSYIFEWEKSSKEETPTTA